MNIKDIKRLRYIWKSNSRYEYTYTYKSIKFYVYADMCGKVTSISTRSPNYPVGISLAHFSKQACYKAYRKDRLKTLRDTIKYNFKHMLKYDINAFHDVLWRTIKYQFSYLKLLIRY